MSDDAALDAPSLARRVLHGHRTTGVERAAFALLALVLVLAAFGNDWGSFYPDNKPEVYLAPDRAVANSLSTWLPSPKQAGLPSFDTGLAPVAAASWVLRSAGLAPWLAVRAWRAGLLLVAAWGAVRLFDDLHRDRQHAAARVAVAALYAINPYVVLQGTTSAVLLPYALLPWLLLFVDRSLAEPGRWRWPAASALALAAMSGMNAGVIPMLLVALSVPALVVHRRLTDGLRWTAAAGALGRCGILGLGVSLYWLVPAALAATTGAAVAGATESTESIAQSTSFVESLRLTGIWTLYGRAGDRLFSPGYSSYLTSVAVVLATLALPIAAAAGALVSRARSRVLAVLLLLGALPMMVGLFPTTSRSPFGAALAWGFENVPGLIGFRTTNKAGPIVALALALLAAEGAAVIAARLTGRPPAVGGAVAAGAALTVALTAFPSWSGNLYRQSFDVPEHWRQAGAALDDGDPATRALVLPGGNGANYRWGMRSPDDLFHSVTDREVVARSTVAPAHNPAANVIAHLDTAIAEQALPDGTLSVLARYLGVGEVLARNDYRWEEVRAARPAVITAELRSDDGLEELDPLGPRGTWSVRPPDPDVEPTGLDEAEGRLESILRFAVRDPLPMVRASPVAGSLLVVGDGGALPELARLGMLAGTPTLRLAGDVAPAEAAVMLEHGARVVLTDTNRRRTGGINRVRSVWSETLDAAAPVDAGEGPSPTLWPDDPQRQTTTRLEGAARVTSSVEAFDNGAAGKPTFAVDGDEDTRWVTGRLGTAVGQWIEVELTEPADLGSVDLMPFGDEGLRIGAVRLTTDQGSASFALTDEERQRAPLPTGPTRHLRIEITALSGSGTGGVGFREIVLPTGPVREVAVLPRDLDRLAAEPAVAAALRTAPIDIVLQRQRGLPFDRADDEERRLDRDLTLPADRAMTFTGSLSTTAQIPPDAFVALFQGWEDGGRLDDDRCFEVAALDGEPLRARVVGTIFQLITDETVALEPCDPAPLDLAAGAHALRSAPGWEIDSLRFTSVGDAPTAAGEPPVVAVRSSSDTSLDVDLGPADAPYYLTSGRGWDERWQATLDGRDLGRPLLLDGYASGWLVEDLGPHHLEVDYAPQTWLPPAFAASGLTALVCALLVLRRRRAS